MCKSDVVPSLLNTHLGSVIPSRTKPTFCQVAQDPGRGAPPWWPHLSAGQAAVPGAQPPPAPWTNGS